MTQLGPLTDVCPPSVGNEVKWDKEKQQIIATVYIYYALYYFPKDAVANSPKIGDLK